MKLFLSTLTVLAALVGVSLFTVFYAAYRADDEANYDKQLARTVAKRVLSDMRVFQSKSLVHVQTNREAMFLFTKYCVHYLVYEDSWIKKDTSLCKDGHQDSVKIIYLTDEEIIDNILSQQEFPKYIFLLACRSVEEQEIALRGMIQEILIGSYLAYNRKVYIKNLYKFLKY